MDQSPDVDIRSLVASHYAAVYRYACRLTGNAADAEDVTQQTFLRAQRALSQLRDAERADRWLLRIARNEFLRVPRRPLARMEVDLPAPSVGAKEDAEEVAEALRELAEEFRVPLLLFYFEELSYREIAEELGIPLGTVMSRLSRGRDYLRERLTPEPAPDGSVPPAVRFPPRR
ncbi:RNA polymerase sigma factor [Planctomyces sp. SH-PL14]|uniref:RNA polymerase sigma factor n=1 Tax=Planctomyces sp. SH-PL14 TaxID=1632864 RepID=UPI00078C7E00|nr:sigma-70 family RNA polymerase sigma factor [Planctomyces sp. SH-PL14]AMV21539.1 ECF RNA polymerase sigma factor SigE [Planctomyces sp. SH-PL14]